MWPDRLQGRLTPLPAPRWAAGRNWRAYRHADRIRCCRSAENDPSRKSAIPSASASLRPRSKTVGWPVACPLRIRACASFALSYVSSSSNHRQSGGRVLEEFHKPGCERLARLIDQAVATQPLQVFINADQAERPRSRRREVRHCRQGVREELPGHHLKAAIRRTPHAYTNAQSARP